MFRIYKVVKLMLLTLGIIVIIITFSIKRSIDIEEYCLRQARQIVGDKWATWLEPNPEEYGGFVSPKGKIALGFREQLKCERNQKFFFLF